MSTVHTNINVFLYLDSKDLIWIEIFYIYFYIFWAIFPDTFGNMSKEKDNYLLHLLFCFLHLQKDLNRRKPKQILAMNRAPPSSSYPTSNQTFCKGNKFSSLREEEGGPTFPLCVWSPGHGFCWVLPWELRLPNLAMKSSGNGAWCFMWQQVTNHLVF